MMKSSYKLSKKDVLIKKRPSGHKKSDNNNNVLPILQEG